MYLPSCLVIKAWMMLDYLDGGIRGFGGNNFKMSDKGPLASYFLFCFFAFYGVVIADDKGIPSRKRGDFSFRVLIHKR